MSRPRRLRQKEKESLLLPQPGAAPDSLRATMAAYLEAMAVKQYTAATCASRAWELLRFARWCEERAVLKPTEVTRTLLERYQRKLFYARKSNGQPLSPVSQAHAVVALKQYFRWLAKRGQLDANPASELEAPRVGARLHGTR